MFCLHVIIIENAILKDKKNTHNHFLCKLKKKDASDQHRPGSMVANTSQIAPPPVTNFQTSNLGDSSNNAAKNKS